MARSGPSPRWTIQLSRFDLAGAIVASPAIRLVLSVCDPIRGRDQCEGGNSHRPAIALVPQGCGESNPGQRFWRPLCFRNTSPLESRKATLSGRLLGYQVWISPGMPQRPPPCSCFAVAWLLAVTGMRDDGVVFPLLSHVERLSQRMSTIIQRYSSRGKVLALGWGGPSQIGVHGTSN